MGGVAALCFASRFVGCCWVNQPAFQSSVSAQPADKHLSPLALATVLSKDNPAMPVDEKA
jgi:hypothetical protein